MNADSGRGALLVAGAAVGYVVFMAANPARPSLRDGGRCLRRYPRVFLLPAAFALAHAGFNLWVRAYESWTVPGAPPIIGAWSGWQPPPWADVLAAGRLPTGESCAAIFNCVVTTFPLSALGAALFLGNWRSSQGVLARGLRRRFGWVGGTLVHLGLALGAVAALCKPVFFGGLPLLNLYLGAVALERIGEITNWLSFVFEYGLGVSVQVYLVLLCYAWIRGLSFDFESLRRFALRRFAVVVKWSLVILIVSGLGINLPLVVSSFQNPDHRLDPTRLILGTRWSLIGTLFVLNAVQILLIFHNESLLRALADQRRLWSRHAWRLAWFLVVVALHFFLLETANALFPLALGPWTWPAAVWNLILHPLLWSGLASWFLVSWVCLFQRCERNRPDTAELVKF